MDFPAYAPVADVLFFGFDPLPLAAFVAIAIALFIARRALRLGASRRAESERVQERPSPASYGGEGRPVSFRDTGFGAKARAAIYWVALVVVAWMITKALDYAWSAATAKPATPPAEAAAPQEPTDQPSAP